MLEIKIRREEKKREKNPTDFIPDIKSTRNAASFLTGTRSRGAGPGKPVNGRQYFGIPSD